MLHRHPYGKIISSPRSSELFAALDEDSQQRFFHLQMQRRMEHEYLAYDITSISSYSELIRFVKYGKNKEHDALPQINLALLYGESSRLPVYYRSLPGNISDVTTVKRLIDELGYLSIEKLKIILDRGFYSEDNINGLLSHHYKFLISVKTSLRLVQTMLDEVRESLPTRQYYNSNFRLYCTSRTIAWPYEERKARLGEVESGTRRMYLHLYYDDERAMEERTAFNILLDSLEAELKEGIRNPEHETLYQKYYEVTQTPVRGVTLNSKQKAIDKVERNYGYFGLLSNDIKDPLEALRIYRTKDLVEKAIA
ncbi:MAG TPA: transposase, partial [Rectinema sp.]|nr:transposase [Rectinema sp.]